jgi:malate permease and related proteins
VLTVLTLLLVGVALGQLRWLPAGAGPVLDAVVIRVSLPALIVSVVPELDLGGDVLVPVVVAWGRLSVLMAAVWLLSRALGLGATTRATLLLVVPLANTSFLGYPAVEALLGRSHLPAAVVYDQLGSFVALATYGSFLASRAGAGPTPRLATLVRRVVTFPPFVGLLVGLALLPLGGPPGPVAEVVDTVGATVTPLAMIAVGLRLELRPGGWRPGVLALGLGLSLVVAPALAFGLATAVGGTGVAWETAVLQSGMPPMVVAAVLAADVELDAELASRLVGVGVLVAMATLPAWAAVL